MHVFLIAVGMHINDYIASITTEPCNYKPICITDLIQLNKKALGMQNKNLGFQKTSVLYLKVT